VGQSIARLHAEGLAHTNVRPESLVFKGRRADGRVQPLLLGLVAPSFDPAALGSDVRQLAEMTCVWIRQPRIDALRPEVRATVQKVRDHLSALATRDPEAEAPIIGELLEVIASALAAIDPNFQVLREHGGDVGSFAEVLVRHAVYHRLFALDVSDE
jgi:hypothetical protein